MPVNSAFARDLDQSVIALRRDGVYKTLNFLDSPQSAWVEMEGRGRVLVLSSNNYLGLSDNPAVVDAGRDALRKWGAGTGSVRFICGTFTVHRDLEEAIARFVGTAASLSYVSAWNANEGLTATIVEEGDFVVSDALNHASIIDSVRLAKTITRCTTAVYRHGDMDDLRSKLATAAGARRRIIWTDGVFSMEGSIAKLPDILQIARDHDAVVVMDDSHGTGVLGPTGRGTADHFGLVGEVDIITSTLGKALGGAAGGFVAGSAALCDYLTQRSRPQLFSNALPPTVAASALQAIRVVESEPDRVERLRSNTRYFRERIVDAGFHPLPGETPIIPLIVGETAAAIRMSELLLANGVFVTGFGFPVVPQGQARVRCQISAAHTPADLDLAIDAFKLVGRKLGII
ncbi:MAG: glycine C-acetyltransferase [Gemmatimonadaceae bacterium]